MSLLFIDGFDHYDPQQPNEAAMPCLGWGKVNALNPDAISIAGRRPSSLGLRFPDGGAAGGYSKTLPSMHSTLIAGCAIKLPRLPTQGEFTLLSLLSGNATPVRNSVTVSPTGQLLVKQGDWTTLGNSTVALAAEVWNFIEFRLVQSNTIGVVEVRVNGVVWISLAGQNTLQSGLGLATVCIGAYPGENTSYPLDVDDFYVVNASGTANNAYLGDIRIDTLYPDSAGANTAFTATPPGSNWSRVDEALPDLADHVQSTFIGQRDTYNYQALPAMNTPTVLGVQTVALAKKTDAGAGNLKFLAMNGGAYGVSANALLTAQAAMVTAVFETNPQGGAAWTEAAINTAQFGVESA